MTGCPNIGSKAKDDYIIRIEDISITIVDFNKAVEIAKIAYPHNSIKDKNVINEFYSRILNQQVEELILLSEAKRLNIHVSESDLKKAVDNIKGDYPEDEFEKTLLENAISYASWERRLKTRLIMQKVIQTELEDKITITQEDIRKYYEEHYAGNSSSSELPSESAETNNRMILQLRKTMAEEAYGPWLQELRENYKDKIELNETRWKEILASAEA